GQVATGDDDGTLLQVEGEDVLGVAVDHAFAAQQVDGRPVAVGGPHLALVDVPVDIEVIVPRVSPHEPEDALVLLGQVRTAHQVGRDEGTRVDHGVVRPAGALVEHDRPK